MEDFGISYAHTLNAWTKRFNQQINTVEKLGYDQQFQRMWNFYLSYCEGGFIERSISVVHLLFTKPASQRQQILTVV